MKITKANLEKLVEKWKQILRLQDWDVRVKLAPGNEFNDKAIANIQYELKNKSALLKVNTSVYKHTEVQEEHAIEDTIIHELLHLHFAWLDLDLANNAEFVDLNLEQALESIGPALYWLNVGYTKKGKK